MKSQTTKGLICVKNKLNIEFVISVIEYTCNEDNTFRYVFTPYYDVIDLLDGDFCYQGIPGLDLSLRRVEYIRENIVPCFISERVPNENREDYYSLLNSVGLDYMNPIVYLQRTKLQYSGDLLYVKEYKDRCDIVVDDIIGKSNTIGVIKTILNNIAVGNNVRLTDGTCMNNKDVFNTLLFLYEKSVKNSLDKFTDGIIKAKNEGKYKGRKPKYVDMIEFEEQYIKYQNGEVSAVDAANNLNISKDKFYRLIKKKNAL